MDVYVREVLVEALAITLLVETPATLLPLEMRCTEEYKDAWSLTPDQLVTVTMLNAV